MGTLRSLSSKVMWPVTTMYPVPVKKQLSVHMVVLKGIYDFHHLGQSIAVVPQGILILHLKLHNCHLIVDGCTLNQLDRSVHQPSQRERRS
ncbi:hypothetical protein UY3_08433 [Chelonia mydas]|uniref:Uncharacterized protein n=1 Tax=Chelonia mydas TaxID=8469 RepID=M7B8X8_CHEMY|nr:hypothetical protein UY3_08433 [Chelonia mydas]